ncbi:hypothetical protein LINPERPRIM_LOCUS36783, partial [Linum perenne]
MVFCNQMSTFTGQWPMSIALTLTYFDVEVVCHGLKRQH